MEIVLAKPRGFCAGVVRAVEVVEAALDLYGPPVYVLHEIVHNQRVLADLQRQGAVFVESLERIPQGATAIFSAHGVSNEAVDRARQRCLTVIDATCPLVSKVHLEVARHAREGREVVLIGHAGHPEIVGTLGRYDEKWGGKIYLVDTVSAASRLRVHRPNDLAYVTQTTLSLSESAKIIEALQQRFPLISGPRKDDICYATQNRQNAVRKVAEQVDVLLVVGARNSSNSNRLREVGEQAGISAYLLQDAGELQPAWIRGVTRIGIAAGASTPEVLIEDLLQSLEALGECHITEISAEPETVSFRLPDRLSVHAAPH